MKKVFLMIIFSISCIVLAQQTEHRGGRAWLQHGTNYLKRQKNIINNIVKSALRKPSLVGLAGILGGLYLTSPHAKAETIFVAKDKYGNVRDLTPAEHQLLYPVKLESQFTTARCYATDYEPSYATADYNPNVGETEVIQKKIDKLLPGHSIEAVYVPDTVYALNAINLFNKKIIDLPPKNANTPQEMCAINISPEIKKADLIINNSFAHYIKTLFSSPTQNAFSSFFKPKKIERIEKSISTQDWRDLAHTLVADDPTLKNNSNIIDASIDAEIEAKKTNQHLLWRGVGKINEFDLQDPIDRYRKMKYSLSYGNSLLGSYLHNPGATPFHYAKKMGVHKREMGYALPISKLNYGLGRSQDIESDLYIPPLGILGALSSKEYSFFDHPRFKFAQKVPQSYTNEEIPEAYFMVGTEDQKKEKINAFLKHLYKNMIPLTPKAHEVKKSLDQPQIQSNRWAVWESLKKLLIGNKDIS